MEPGRVDNSMPVQNEIVSNVKKDRLLPTIINISRDNNQKNFITNESNQIGIVQTETDNPGKSLLNAKILGNLLQPDITLDKNTRQKYIQITPIDNNGIRYQTSGHFHVSAKQTFSEYKNIPTFTTEVENSFTSATKRSIESFIVYSDSLFNLLGNNWLYEQINPPLSKDIEFAIKEKISSNKPEDMMTAVNIFFNTVANNPNNPSENIENFFQGLKYLMIRSNIDLPQNITIASGKSQDGQLISTLNINEITQNIDLDEKTIALAKQLIEEKKSLLSKANNVTLTFDAIYAEQLSNGKTIVIKHPRSVDSKLIIEKIRQKEDQLNNKINYAQSEEVDGFIIQPFINSEEIHPLLSHQIYQTLTKVAPREVPRDSFQDNIFFTHQFGPVVIDTA